MAFSVTNALDLAASLRNNLADITGTVAAMTEGERNVLR